MPALTSLQYIKQELYPASATEFMREWRLLSDEDKSWYKRAAEAEMQLLGLEIKSS